MELEWWNLKRASEELGVNRETVRRAVLAGELRAEWAPGEGGRKGYRVQPSEARLWHAAHFSPLLVAGGLGGTGGAGGTGKRDCSEGVEQVEQEELPEGLSSPQRGTDANTLQMALVVAQQALAAREAVERELQTERAQREEEALRAERAERQALALSYELRNYQRALSESAESLAEERAKRMAYEIAIASQELSQENDLKRRETVSVELPNVSVPRQTGGWARRFRKWLNGEKNSKTA